MALQGYGTPVSRQGYGTFRHILPNCRGQIIQEGAEIICTSCGATYSRDPEYQTEQRSTFQSTWSFHPTSLGTTNAIETPNIRFGNLTPQYTREVKIMEMVDRITRALELPTTTRMTAARLAVKVLKEQTAKKTSLLPICIYAIVQTCRNSEAQRSLTQILKAAEIYESVDQEQIFREFNRLMSRSNMTYRNSSPEDYLNAIIKKLDRVISDSVYLRAVHLRARDIMGSTRYDWQGKSPIRVAAYCIYTADVELGYKIGVDILCSVTQMSPEIIKIYASKIDSQNYEEEVGERRPRAKEVEAFFEKESRSFKVFLAKPE